MIFSWRIYRFADAALGGVLRGVECRVSEGRHFQMKLGVGSAAIAHAAVKTKYAASEGVVALLEPFIDTVISLYNDCSWCLLLLIWKWRFND